MKQRSLLIAVMLATLSMSGCYEIPEEETNAAKEKKENEYLFSVLPEWPRIFPCIMAHNTNAQLSESRGVPKDGSCVCKESMHITPDVSKDFPPSNQVQCNDYAKDGVYCKDPYC